MTEHKFVHISRVIDPKTRIHYLDAIDEEGRHWMAEMSHQKEEWIVYTKCWKLAPQKMVTY
jgi:poly(3-hydroxyalkanoate) synthetase